jgi:GntR family transcriptional regulator/MocR family aminotransferase
MKWTMPIHRPRLPCVEVHVSLVGRRDLTGEIYRQVRGAILDGRLRGGEALPPTRELANRLSVSRTTVSVAYDRLISEGFASARMGSGTYVSPHVSSTPSKRRLTGGALRPRPFWDDVPLPTGLWRPAEFDLRTGIPDARLFPYESWRRLMSRQFRPAAVGHGAYGDPAGHVGMREAIARHIGTSRGVRSTGADVVVTNGTQQAVDIIGRVLIAPGDRVAVEDPGYGPPRRALASIGARVSGVPVDREGLVVDALPPDTRLVYVAPSHQLPLGMSMSLARRMALLAWAERHGAAVIEDDYDSEFRFDGRPIEPLHTLDPHGRVIYVGSFSKTMLPTLRLGFMVVPPSLLRAVEAAKYLTDWHTALPTQAAMATFIDRGLFARHVRRMRAVYTARHRRIVEVLARDFADELEVIPSSVGLHLAAFARSASVDRVRSIVGRATASGVACFPLSLFAAGERQLAGVAIGYGGIGLDDIDEALRRLRRAFIAKA